MNLLKGRGYQQLVVWGFQFSLGILLLCSCQPSRKYVPIFFDRYMELAGIESKDFEFYFNRSFEPGYMYLVGAQLSPEDHFAENGFIFTIDRVVPPLKNVEQLLESSEAGNDYSYFRDLIYVFPEFRKNVSQPIAHFRI